MKTQDKIVTFLLFALAVPVAAQEDHLADMLHAQPGRERSERLVVMAADEREHGDATAAIELATLAATEAINHGLVAHYAEAMLELSTSQLAKGLLEEAIGSALRASMISEGADSDVHDTAIRKLGALYLTAGQPHKALESLKAVSPTSDASTRARDLVIEVQAQAMILDNDAMISYLQNVLTEFKRIAAPTLKYQVLTLLADAQSASGALEDAMHTEEKVTQLALDLRMGREAAISANNRIVLAQRSGQNDKAFSAYARGMELSEGNDDLRVAMNGNVALTYAASGDHERALAYAQQAVREAEGLQGASLADALRTKAAVQVTNGDLGEAQNAAVDALKAAESNNSIEGQLAACDLLAWILDRRNMTTEARAYDRRARDLQLQRNAKMQVEAGLRRERAYRLQHIEMAEVDRLNDEAHQESRMKEMALNAANAEKQMKLLLYEKELDASARREAVLAHERATFALEQVSSRLQAERSEQALRAMESERKIQSLSLTQMELEKQEKQRAIELLEQRNATVEVERQKEHNMRTFMLMLVLGSIAATAWMTWAWVVTRRKKRTIWEQHQHIKHINEQLEDRDKDISSSLRYARTIQEAILPTESDLKACMNESFILYRPLDVVSGDLPFIRRIGNKVFVAAIDCTGHGVPAAMMTFIAYYGLSELLQQNPDAPPGQILDGLHRHVRKAMETRSEGALYNDGFDIGLCVIDLGQGQLSFSGAQLPLFVVRDGEVRRLKADILPIGDDTFDRKAGYRTETVKLRDQDHLFLSSDGLIHQFGGERHRTFSTKRLQHLLSETGGMSMQEVKTRADEMFQQWKGTNAQTDDLLLIGMRYAA